MKVRVTGLTLMFRYGDCLKWEIGLGVGARVYRWGDGTHRLGPRWRRERAREAADEAGPSQEALKIARAVGGRAPAVLRAGPAHSALSILRRVIPTHSHAACSPPTYSHVALHADHRQITHYYCLAPSTLQPLHSDTNLHLRDKRAFLDDSDLINLRPLCIWKMSNYWNE